MTKSGIEWAQDPVGMSTWGSTLEANLDESPCLIHMFWLRRPWCFVSSGSPYHVDHFVILESSQLKSSSRVQRDNPPTGMPHLHCAFPRHFSRSLTFMSVRCYLSLFEPNRYAERHTTLPIFVLSGFDFETDKCRWCNHGARTPPLRQPSLTVLDVLFTLNP
jgi:hypothetical protein